MPLVHIERAVRRGSHRLRRFRLVPDWRSELWDPDPDPEPGTWSGVCGAVLSPGAESDTFSGIPPRGDRDARRTFNPLAATRFHGRRRRGSS